MAQFAKDSYQDLRAHLVPDRRHSPRQQQVLSGGARFPTQPFDPTEVLLSIGNLRQTRRRHLELRPRASC
jgi:hypothetical protein